MRIRRGFDPDCGPRLQAAGCAVVAPFNGACAARGTGPAPYGWASPRAPRALPLWHALSGSSRRCSAAAFGCSLGGQEIIAPLPQHTRIVPAGFLSDAKRDALIGRAVATVVTAKQQSLLPVMLQSLALGTSVVVNGRPDVPRADAQHFGAGWAWVLRGDLLPSSSLRAAALPAAEHQALGQAARNDVQRQDAWPRVAAEWLNALQRVVPATAPG